MITRTLLAAASLAVAVSYPLAGDAAETFPQYNALGRARAAGENPYYHVNRYGYGNYVMGADGSVGGYAAGSSGARQLEINQELKCRSLPESC